MKIDPNMSEGPVEVVGDVLVIEDLPLDGITEALAKQLKSSIAAQGWVQSGRMLAGVTADENTVRVPSDRLRRDEKLRVRFVEEVMPDSPLDDRNVKEATAEAVREAITVKKARRLP